MNAHWSQLTDRGAVVVTGSERVRWLDGMVTQDVAALDPGDFAPTLLLTHQGRIVSDAWLWVFEDRIHLDLDRSAVAPLIEHLDRLIIADDVKLTDASDDGVRFSVEGAGARAAVEAAAGAALSGIASVVLAGAETTLVPHALIEDEGVQLLAADADALGSVLSEAGIPEASAAVLEIRRVERGVPRYGKELDTSVLPAETRLEAAISTTKGCYAGQEVVARMRSRGAVSSLLVSLHFEGGALPAEGEKITLDGKKVGELTSVARSEALGGIGLGYVKAARAEPGTRVEVGGANAVVVLPATG